MGNFTFENQGTNTYLVYEIQDGDELDSMSLGMLTNNRIPGFAPAAFMQMDMTKFIKYNVSAKVSVTNLFSGPVNKKRLVGVFSGIVDAMLSAEDYMLDPQSVLLDLDYIFADVSTCETVLVCLPVHEPGKAPVDLGTFFKNIIFRTQFDQTENCDHVAQIINYLNGSPVLSLADFKVLLDGLKNPSVQAAPQPVPQSAPQPQVVTAPPKQEVKPQPVVNTPPAQPVYQPVQTQPVNQGRNGVIHGYQPQQAPAQPPIHPPVAPRQNPAPQQAPVASDEKPISMLYLLQHYNKENAAKYKAQQEAKKAQKGTADNKKKQTAPPAPQKAPQSRPAAGFAIPNQNPQNPGFSIPNQPAQPMAPQPVPQQSRPYQQPAPQAPQQQYQPIPQPVPQYQQNVPASKPISFGETTVLGGQIGETTVLGGAVEQVKQDPHLMRARNNERIPLNKPVFRIGKEKSYVDYFISDNTAVSRSHANIINRDGVFYVVDTNSTNHTYVNGAMIPSNQETQLTHGAKLRLANEEFEFKMY